ncbi:TPA: hypothetical protein N0F65_001505 [Lagenidium giganteum]|uniref:Molybdopterin synthase sulfur carrier subunit n=1 Tax=Lagenidium giganteum TaxID=4803 RepID=A0AAV2Z3W1_9STRA|nr:TPA: hypothetical protein N0F65_001505 [Lagenidium giganteum]
MIKVLYFAAARDEIGPREEEFALDGVKVVADLRAKLCAKYASAAEILRGVTFARNLEYVEDDAPVHAGDEIAVIPPISGG